MLRQYVGGRPRPRIGHHRQPPDVLLAPAQRVAHPRDQVGMQRRLLCILDLGPLVHDGITEIKE